MGLEGRLFRPGHPTSVTSQKQPTGYSCRRTLQWIADRNERSQGANYPLESNEGTRGGSLRVGNSQGAGIYLLIPFAHVSIERWRQTRPASHLEATLVA